jgi:hypothetical protein
VEPIIQPSSAVPPKVPSHHHDRRPRCGSHRPSSELCLTFSPKASTSAVGASRAAAAAQRVAPEPRSSTLSLRPRRDHRRSGRFRLRASLPRSRFTVPAPASRTVIVDFGPVGHDSCTYLLPAAVHRDSSDRWHLVGPKGQSEHRRHLKLPLLGEIRNGQAPDNASTAGAVAFVALALREARRVFLQTQADTYGRIRLRWAMNLGIPSAGYDDEGIRSRFLEVARAAWTASFRPAVSSTMSPGSLWTRT